MNRSITTPFLAVAFSLMPSLAPGIDSWTDRCVAVIDGDTIVVARGADRVEVELEGIDCPELGQAFGEEAKRFTASKVCRQIVKVSEKENPGGQVHGRVAIFGRDLSLSLVEEGLAWHDHRERQDPALAKAELEARQAQKSLWSGRNPIAPWVWRLGHREPIHPHDGCL